MARPLTAKELKQRRDAAAKRRKGKDFQVGMTAFKRAGLTGKDVKRDGKSVSGTTAEGHEKLLKALRLMGVKVPPVGEDGSVNVTLPNDKKLSIGAGPEGKFYDSRGKAWDPRVYSLENGRAVKRSKG